jgi:glycosyltransferase involved in cell wall biosynthesis
VEALGVTQHPDFSVVIPTRNRPQLAIPTIKRLLGQTWQNFEIVVLENSDEPSLGHLEALDRRVRVVPSSRPLSMPDNWQRGLDLARGEYVLYVSDKDWVVPYALEELSDVVTAHTRPPIVNLRRAVWFPPGSPIWQGLLMQQGTGQIAVLPTKDAISRWFRAVNNHMNAPMIYNSVVKSDFLSRVRQRYGGRLFFGNSPDVGSGQILLANCQTYVVLDRVHTMAEMGPWSIGWATITKGRRGPAAGFANEFGDNPLDRYDLVWSLTGVVVETLLACKEAEPELLANYDINWYQYCRLCLGELERRAQAGEDTSEDLQRLKRGSSQTYSRTTWMLASASRRYWRQIAWLQAHAPFKFALPPYDGWRRRFGLDMRGETLPPPVSFIDEICFRKPIPSATPEDAFAFLLGDQQKHQLAATVQA